MHLFVFSMRKCSLKENQFQLKRTTSKFLISVPIDLINVVSKQTSSFPSHTNDEYNKLARLKTKNKTMTTIETLLIHSNLANKMFAE